MFLLDTVVMRHFKSKVSRSQYELKYFTSKSSKSNQSHAININFINKLNEHKLVWWSLSPVKLDHWLSFWSVQLKPVKTTKPS